jgi:hypothetical protein
VNRGFQNLSFCNFSIFLDGEFGDLRLYSWHQIHGPVFFSGDAPEWWTTLLSITGLQIRKMKKNQKNKHFPKPFKTF